ncbi:hypothetical protein [Shewanella sp. GXUN23E]|uniref:hypothetical protein n=1 Tax=Shewanella sp. GXUN23E TaxID=3422498 RepID=UPI003D7C9591
MMNAILLFILLSLLVLSLYVRWMQSLADALCRHVSQHCQDDWQELQRQAAQFYPSANTLSAKDMPTRELKILTLERFVAGDLRQITANSTVIFRRQIRYRRLAATFAWFAAGMISVAFYGAS